MSVEFSNRGYVSDLADWIATGAGASVAHEPTESAFTPGSCKATVPATSFTGIARHGTTGHINVDANTQYTISVYVKGPSGALLRIFFQNYNGGTFISNINSSNHTCNGSWQRVTFTWTTPANTTNIRALSIQQPSNSPQAIDFYADGWQLDLGATALEYDGPDAAPPPPVQPTQLYKLDLETGNTSQAGQVFAPADRLTVITGENGEGNYVGRFELRPGDLAQAPAEGHRCELGMNQFDYRLLPADAENPNREYWVGFAIKYPSNFPMEGRWAVTGCQFKNDNAGTGDEPSFLSPPLIIGPSRVGGPVSTTTMAVRSDGLDIDFWEFDPLFNQDRWHRFVIRLRVSSDPLVGFIEVYYGLDGQALELQTLRNGLTRWYIQTTQKISGVDQPLRPRIGYYRDSAHTNNGHLFADYLNAVIPGEVDQWALELATPPIIFSAGLIPVGWNRYLFNEVLFNEHTDLGPQDYADQATAVIKITPTGTDEHARTFEDQAVAAVTLTPSGTDIRERLDTGVAQLTLVPSGTDVHAKEYLDQSTAILKLSPTGSDEHARQYSDQAIAPVSLIPNSVDILETVDGATTQLAIVPSAVEVAEFVDSSIATLALAPATQDVAGFVDSGSSPVGIFPSGTDELITEGSDQATVPVALVPSGSDTGHFIDGVERPQLVLDGSPTFSFDGSGRGYVFTDPPDRIRAPSTLGSTTQGWFAICLAMGWASSSPPVTDPMTFVWGDDGNNVFYLYRGATGWAFIRRANGTHTIVATSNSFASGATQILLLTWTSSQIRISINGGSFISTGNVHIPTLANPFFDIGSAGNVIAGRQIQSNIHWAAMGIGTLDTGSLTLFNGFGLNGPSWSQFPSGSQPTFLAHFNDQTYQDAAALPTVGTVPLLLVPSGTDIHSGNTEDQGVVPLIVSASSIEEAHLVDAVSVPVALVPSGTDALEREGGDQDTASVIILPSGIETTQFVDAAQAQLTLEPQYVESVDYADSGLTYLDIVPSGSELALTEDSDTVALRITPRTTYMLFDNPLIFGTIVDKWNAVLQSRIYGGLLQPHRWTALLQPRQYVASLVDKWLEGQLSKKWLATWRGRGDL